MKTIYKIVIVLVLVLISAGIIISIKADDLLKSFVTDRIQNLSHNKYNLKIGETDVALIPLGVNFSNLEITSDDSTFLEMDSTTYILPSFRAKKLNIDKFSLFNFLFNSKASFKLHVEQPELHVLVSNLAENSVKPKKLEDKGKTKVLLKSAILENGAFSYSRDTMHFSTKINIQASDINSENFVSTLSSSVNATLYDADYRGPQGIMGIKSDTLNIYGAEGKIIAKNVSVNTLADKYEIGHILGHETDWVDVSIASIEIMQNSALTLQDTVAVGTVKMDGLTAVVFRDKRLKFPNIPDKPLPHQKISNLTFPIIIDTIELANGNITYQEHISESPKAGRISFENLAFSASNFSSACPNSKMSMKASAYLMGKGLIEIDAKIPLSSQSMPYEISGTIHEQDMTNLNPMLNYVAKVTLTSGRFRNSTFEFTHDNVSSKGQLKLAYNDLHVRFIDPAGSGTLGKIDEKLMSFAANTFVVKKDNEEGDNMRTGEISFERDPKKSILNYWWKSLLSGIKSSTGIKEKK